MDEFQPRRAPTVVSTTPAPLVLKIPEQVFQINIADTIAPILPSIWGNNANFYLYGLENDSAGLAHLRATGVKNLRLPGGNASNDWLWDETIHWEFWENYRDVIANRPENVNNVLSVNEMAAIADSVGAMVQPCVNLSLARYIKGSDSVQQAAHYAAEWVRQWNGVEGRGVKYWEVGNENFGSWQSGYTVNGKTITGTMYGEAFNVFVDSMKAADPTIKIGAVVYEGEVNIWTGKWNQELLPIIQDKADFLAVHLYFTWAKDYNNITVQQMVDALPQIKNTIQFLEHQVDSLTNKTADHFPIALTEYNVQGGRKNSQQISAVFSAMALGEYIRNGYGLVNIWDVANGFGLDGADHGMLTRLDPNRDNFDPNPTFYAYFLTQKYFGDQLLGVVPEEGRNVRVYPTLFVGGELGVLVVNSGNQKRTIQLDLNGFVGNGTMTSHSLIASGPESRQVYLNGVSESIYSGPLNYQDIAPYAHTYNTSPVVEVEPYSVNAYLIPPLNPTVAALEQSKAHRNEKVFMQSIFVGEMRLKVDRRPVNVIAVDVRGQQTPIAWTWNAGVLELRSETEAPVLCSILIH